MGKVIVGIDIAYEAVKVIALEKKGADKFNLIGLNVASIPEASWSADELKNQEEISKVIHEAFRGAKPHAISGKQVMMSLPESAVFSGTFSVPNLSKKELTQSLPFEIAEKLSIDLDEYSIDYELTNSACRPILGAEHKMSVDSGSGQEIKDTDGDGDAKPSIRSGQPPVASMPPVSEEKSPIESGIVKEKPKAVPINLDLPQTTGTKMEQTAVFAVAAKKTLIDSVVDLGELTHLEIAGIDIKSGAIARAIAPSDAKMRLIVELSANTTIVMVTEGNSLRLTSAVPIGVHAPGAHPLMKLEDFKGLAGPIFDELSHVTKFYENRICPGNKIVELILSGGGSNIEGIADLFQTQMGLPTSLGNPLKNVDIDHYPIKPDLARTFTGSIGLAMRGLNA